jgi:hypothetical protein
LIEEAHERNRATGRTFNSPFVGSEIEFRIFDPQNCEYIQAD